MWLKSLDNTPKYFILKFGEETPKGLLSTIFLFKKIAIKRRIKLLILGNMLFIFTKKKIWIKNKLFMSIIYKLLKMNMIISYLN